jgi:aldose 1-epimerase
MAILSFLFGDIDGLPVPGFTLSNRSGLQARLIAYGACLTEMHVPDRQGRFADVVLGFDDLASYRRHQCYFGATCGRFSNRIAKGVFSLDGERHHLACNEKGINHLHGGVTGFDRRIWTAAADETSNSVLFSLIAPDGDEGYPGTLIATAAYQLTDAGELKIRMTAVSDRPTVVNMVHHSYWNLGGHASGSCRDHRLHIDADHYLPVDETLIPTGEVTAVTGTPFDFRQPKRIADGIEALGGGFDHNWCLTGGPDRVRPVVRLVDRVSGRGLEIETNQPGVQFYSSGALPADGPLGKGGAKYAPGQAVVLETQGFPNAPNTGHFPSVRLAPGGLYDHRMTFRFFTE